MAKDKTKHPLPTEPSPDKALKKESKRLKKLRRREGGHVGDAGGGGGAVASGSGTGTSGGGVGGMDIVDEQEVVRDDEAGTEKVKKDKKKEERGKKRKRDEEIDKPDADQASPSKKGRQDKQTSDADLVEEEPVGRRTSKQAERAHKDKGREEPQAVVPESTMVTNSDSNGMDLDHDVNQEHESEQRDLKRRKKDEKNSRKTDATSSTAIEEAPAAGEDDPKAMKKAEKERKRAEAAELQACQALQEEQQQQQQVEAIEEEPNLGKQSKKEGKKSKKNKGKGKAVEESPSKTNGKEHETVGASKASITTAPDPQASRQKSANTAVASTSATITNDTAATSQVSQFAKPQAVAAATSSSAPVPSKKADKASSKKDKAAPETRKDPSHSKKKGVTQDPTASKQAAAPARARKEPDVDEDSSENDTDIDVESLIQSLMVAHPKSSTNPKAATSGKLPTPTPTGEQTRKVQKDKGKQKAVPKDSPERDGDDKRASIAAFQGMEPMEILRSKWLTTPQLELVKKAHPGFWYSSGRFSRTEEKQLRQAVDRYRSACGLTEAEMVTIISTPRNKKEADANIRELLQGNEGFWPQIAASVDRRSLLSVYNYVKRKYNPLARAGPWTAEQDAALRRAYQEHGTDWQQVGDEVGRAGFDCQDRYQKQLSTKSDRNTGPWNDDEIKRLRQAVAKHGSSSWSVVAKMVGQRTPAQCRNKWTGDIARHDAVPEPNRRFTKPEHRSNLVHALKDLKVKDESEIQSWDFDDPTLKLHSAKVLHDRWKRLLNQALEALNEQDDSKEYSYADKLKWLLNRYPEPGVYLPRKKWLKTTHGTAEKAKIKKKNEKPGLSSSKGSNLSQAFVDSSDDDGSESSSSSEEEEEEDEKEDELE